MPRTPRITVAPPPPAAPPGETREARAARDLATVRGIDWAAVDATTDEDIARQIAEDPDTAPDLSDALTDEEFAAAVAASPVDAAAVLREVEARAAARPMARRGLPAPPATPPASRVEALLIQGMQEAVAFERGEVPALVKRVAGQPAQPAQPARRSTAVQAPRIAQEDVQTLRARLGLSQAVFASALNVTLATVRAWELGTRTPDGATRRLLELVGEHPEWLLARVTPRGAR